MDRSGTTIARSRRCPIGVLRSTAGFLAAVLLLGAVADASVDEEPERCALVEVDRRGDVWINGEPHMLLDIHDDAYRSASGSTLVILMPDQNATMAGAMAFFRDALGVVEEDSRFLVRFVLPSTRKDYLALFAIDPLAVRRFYDASPPQLSTEPGARPPEFGFEWYVHHPGAPAPDDPAKESTFTLSLWNEPDGRLVAFIVDEKGGTTRIGEFSDLRNLRETGAETVSRLRVAGNVEFGAADKVARSLSMSLRDPYTMTLREPRIGFSIRLAEDNIYVPPPPPVERREILPDGTSRAEPAPLEDPVFRTCYFPEGKRQDELIPD